MSSLPATKEFTNQQKIVKIFLEGFFLKNMCYFIAGLVNLYSIVSEMLWILNHNVKKLK